MNEEQYEIFKKRYEKFKNNNLPTRFWDEERQVLEYVYYSSKEKNNGAYDNNLKIRQNLTTALEDIVYTSFYYSFTSGYFVEEKNKDNRFIWKKEIGHAHAHSFEEVVERLYNFPESFSISKDEEEYYSKQELKYLKKVQKYLLFIGMKDIDNYKKQTKRYQNKKQTKYSHAVICSYPNKTINDFLTKKRNFTVIETEHLNFYKDYKEYLPNEKCALITDEEYNFKMFIEYTHQEIKEYKDIKSNYKNEYLKENDKVVVEYFKINETF